MSINTNSFENRDTLRPLTIPKRSNFADKEFSFVELNEGQSRLRVKKQSPIIDEEYDNRDEIIKEPILKIGSAPKRLDNSLPRNIFRSPHLGAVDTPLSSSVGSYRSSISNAAKIEKTLLWDDVVHEEEDELEYAPPPYKVISTNTDRGKIDISHQCKEVDRFTYRHPKFENELLLSRFENIITVADAWKSSVTRYAKEKCLGHRSLIQKYDSLSDSPNIWSLPKSSEKILSKNYSWFTYRQVGEQVKQLATALVSMNCPTGQFIIWSENRPEWIISSLALSQIKGMVSVPLSHTISLETASTIINHSDAHTIFCSSTMLDIVLEMFTELEGIKNIYHFDDLSANQTSKIKSMPIVFEGISFISLRHLYTLGAEAKQIPKWERQSPDDIYTIHYTPGTEDDKPKGAIFTNTNVISAASGLHTSLNHLIDRQVYYSQNSLSITTERCIAQVMLDNGHCIGFSHNASLVDELNSLSPTLMNITPSYTKELVSIIQGKVLQKSAVDRFLLQSILATPHVLHSQNSFSILWDFFLSRRIRNLLGGKLQMLLSIGYSLAESSQFFLQHALNIPVIQGYGLTETFGVGCLQIPGNDDTGIVGSPLSCIEIRLRSSPKLGYFATDSTPTGEILIRGPCLSLGYYKNLSLSKRKFQNGYIFTGDIAKLNADGSFSIIERKRNFISVGYDNRVAVARLERVYEEHPIISRIWISGSASHEYLVGIAFISPEILHDFGKRYGVPTEDIHSKDLQLAILQELSKHAQRRGLATFEQIKNIRLLRSDFESINPKLVTGSKKLFRKQLEQHFADDLEEMFAEIET